MNWDKEPKVRIGGEWVFIMTEEDMHNLQKDIRALKSFYTQEIAKIYRDRLEQSSEATKQIANMAVQHIESQLPEEMRKEATAEVKEAIKKI